VQLKKNKKFIFSYLKYKLKKFYWHKKYRLRLRLKKTNKFPNFFLIRKKGLDLRCSRKKYNRQIKIVITSNNVYCTLLKLENGEISSTLLVHSAGKLKVRMSKKLLRRYALDRILNLFLARVRKMLNAGGVILVLNAPLKIRKRIVRLLFLRLRKYVIKVKKNEKSIQTKGFRSILIKFLSKKIFNGCQAKKQKRKKRKSFRIIR